MPLIKITQEQVNRTLPIEAGWHLFKIEKFVQTPAKPGKNYKNELMFELVCIEEGSAKGRYAYARFYDNALGMFITSGFLPGALDMPIAEMIEFDPETLVGKEIYGETTDSVYEGKIQKRTEKFATASKMPY